MALKMLTKKVVPEVQVETHGTLVLDLPQKVLVQPVDTSSSIEALTTEYIELHKKFVYFEVKSMVKRMDEIRKQLQTLANETMDEKKPAVFSCPAGEMEFSERGKVAEVTAPLELLHHLLEKFGPAVAASVIDVGITPLRKVLSEFELKHYLVEQPGGRTLRSVRPT